MFFNPDRGGSIKITNKIKNFLIEEDPTLQLSGAAEDKIGLFGWRKYDSLAKNYLQAKDAFADQLIKEHGPFSLSDIWNGEGVNRNAALTVFRHFDSATVVQGLVGETPLTGWVIDYPLLERIHYLLVAGFNVYGPVEHQLATRMYMDFLRMDAENNFLRFMPAGQRQKMHDNWYQGVFGKMSTYFHQPYFSAGHETGINFTGSDYKREFFSQTRARLGKAAGPIDSISHCVSAENCSSGTTPLLEEVSKQMHNIARLRGDETALLSEMSLLRVRTASADEDLVYTLLHNKRLKNVAVMFAENLRREPEKDTVTVIPGFVGSYPNFFFSVAEYRLAEFVGLLKTARSDAEKEKFYSEFGILRNNPEIWQYTDWFNARQKKYRGLQAGLFDLNRYQNL